MHSWKQRFFSILDITKKNRTKFADKLKAWIVTRKKLFWRMLEKLETSTMANFCQVFWEEKQHSLSKSFSSFWRIKILFLLKSNQHFYSKSEQSSDILVFTLSQPVDDKPLGNQKPKVTFLLAKNKPKTYFTARPF